MTVPSAADPGADVPSAGYYPDPSIPGFVRYWDGERWLPGTSRPAPREGEELPLPRAAARPSAPSMNFVPPPSPQRPLADPVPDPADESGPIYLDLTTGLAKADPDPPEQQRSESGAEAEARVRWHADAAQQPGLLESGPVPRWVTWGAPEADPPRPLPAAALPVGALPSAMHGDLEALPTRTGTPAAAGMPVAAAPTPASAPAPTSFAAPAAPAPFAAPAPAPVAAHAPGPASAAAPAPAPPYTPTMPSVPTASGLPTASEVPPQGVPGPRRVRAVGGRPSSPEPAPLGRRLAARLLDISVVLGVLNFPGAPLVQDMVTHLQQKIDAARELSGVTTVWLVDPTVLTDAGLLLLMVLGVGLVYEALPTALWGRTLGKAMFGLRVLDRRSKRVPRFGRALARWLSYQLLLVLLVGVLDLLWCLLDRPWRRCWHDRLAGTFVASAHR